MLSVLVGVALEYPRFLTIYLVTLSISVKPLPILVGLLGRKLYLAQYSILRVTVIARLLDHTCVSL